MAGDAMNSTLLKAAMEFVTATALLAYAVAVFVKSRTVPTTLQLVGAACLWS
jgi:hypothetical protein